MRTLLTLLLAGITATCFSQQRIIIVPDANLPKGGMRDTVIERLKELQKSQAPIDNMPNAITRSQPPVYKRNNGEGFDIYQSPVDNMPILMPDSANKASLSRMPDMAQGTTLNTLRKLYKIPETPVIPRYQIKPSKPNAFSNPR